MQPTDLQKRRFRDALWYAAGYEPTSGEFPVYDMDGKLVTTSYGQKEIHDTVSRVKLVTGGVRAGKSMVMAMMCAEHILEQDVLIWLCGPNYDQSKHVFGYLASALKELGVLDGEPSVPRHGGQYMKTPWNCEIMTKSGQDLTTLAGSPPSVFVADEVSQLPPEIVTKAAERTLEKRGAIYLGGTIEKAYPWFSERWEQWQGPNPQNARSFSLPSWSNTALFPGGRLDPGIVEMEGLMSAEEFLERCAAIPCKPSGLVFKEFDRKKHVTKLDYNDKLPVELAIDPATHTYAVEALQFETLTVKEWLERAGNEELLLKRTSEELAEYLTKVYVIDEVYTHDMIAQDVIPLVKSKPWFRDVRTGIIDIAGTQRPGSKSQVQIWQEETRIPLRSNYVKIDQSIAVVRLRLRTNPLIGEPLIQLDYRLRSDKNHAGKANGIIAEAGLYKYREWSGDTNLKTLPIDANNDAWKAVGYSLFAHFGPVEERASLPKARIRGYF